MTDPIEWMVNQLNGNPAMEILFMLLVVIGRLALDRWERRREMEQHKVRRRIRDG